MTKKAAIAVAAAATMLVLLATAYHHMHDHAVSDSEKQTDVEAKKGAVHALGEALAKNVAQTSATADQQQTKGDVSEGKKAVAASSVASQAVDAAEPWAPSTESQRLAPTDPRSHPSKFAWLWKASDPVPVTSLDGNGTVTHGDSDASSNSTDPVEEVKRGEKDAAKKDLELSQDKEMRFFLLWTLSILAILAVGLCSIKYARSILGGDNLKQPRPRHPHRPGQGDGYGAVGGQGYPPG